MLFKIFLLSFLLIIPRFYSQSNTPGFPYVTRFTPEDFGSKEDSWSVVQDKRGIMYFANQSGVLEYDGTSWNLIPLDNNRYATALAIDSTGRIYVGGINTFGYLAPDSKGSMKYIPLHDRLSKPLSGFTEVRKIVFVKDEIFISDPANIFRIKGKDVSVFPSEKRMDFLFNFNNRLIINDPEKGLAEFKNDALTSLPGGEVFKDKHVWVIIPYNKNEMFISGGDGLYIYNGIKATPFKTEADYIFKQFPIFCAIELPRSGNHRRFAIGTIGNGLIILDENGKLLHHLTKESGLNNDQVLSLLIDEQNGLWATHMIGISRIDITGAVSIVDKQLGMDSFSFMIKKHNGRYFAATLTGLYEEDSYLSGKPYIRFKHNSVITSDCRSLFSLNSSDMLIGSLAGTFLYSNGSIKKISDAYTEMFLRSQTDTNLIYAAEFGLRLFYLENGSWIDKGHVDGITESIQYILEDSDGSIWIKSTNDGIIRASGIAERKKPVIEKYGLQQGLPSLSTNAMIKIDGKIYFSYDSGIYSYDKTTNRFYPDSLFHSRFNPVLPYTGLDLLQMENGNICVLNPGNQTSIIKLYVKQKDDSYKEQVTSAVLLNKMRVYFPHQDVSDNVWFVNDNGLYNCNFTNESFPQTPFRIRIRSVYLSKNDSLLYGGNYFQGINIPKLSYDKNSFHFEFAGMSYVVPGQTQYKFFLEGLDEDWSQWDYETRKEYTNLSPGNYIFHVKAKNVFGYESGEATYSFIINPPFWGTWWFRFLLVVFSIASIFLISRFFYLRRILVLQKEQKQNEDFSRMLIASQEQERQRIASDLHDSIGQNILVIKNHAQIGAQTKYSNEEKDVHLQSIAKIAMESLEEVRAISHNLRPIHLEDFGLKDSLQSLVSNVQKISNIYITLIMEFEEAHIPNEYEINIYRIIQESLNNIIKYSEAKNVLVQLMEENKLLTIAVNDDGKGMEEIKEGFGISGMRERVKMVGGEFKIETNKMKGTSIKAIIPLLVNE